MSYIKYNLTKYSKRRFEKIVFDALKTSTEFELFCCKEEQRLLEIALKYGEYKCSNESLYGTVIHGKVTEAFIDEVYNLVAQPEIFGQGKIFPFR